jgi:hypothetical protein
MVEITLFDKLTISNKVEPEVIEFNDAKISNYRIIYKYKSIATLKELIANTDKKIKKKDMREHNEFYINIMAHLIAYYIIRKMNNIDPEYSKYLLDMHRELTEEIYRKLLAGNKDKFEYYGIVWTNKQIEKAFINYIAPKLGTYF